MATPVQRLPRYGHHPHAAPDWAGSGHVYRPRRPTTTPLYPVVQHHLETFLAAQATERDPMGYGVPSWVEKDLRAYLRCGILAHGFARVRCDDCGHKRLLAFSCAGRGVCPSCNTRRMAEVAAHITDHVLPHLPVWHELEHLYPRLSVGGVLIIDDYGHWEGARRAVDEFIEAKGLRLFLSRIDYTGRLAIKLDP